MSDGNAVVDSAVVVIQNLKTPTADSTIIALTPEQGKILAEWLTFMNDAPSRLGVEASIGAVFALIAYAISRFTGHLQLGAQPKALIATIGAGVGLVLAFFIAHFVPGMERGELAIAMMGGGGASALLTKGDQTLRASAIERRLQAGMDPTPSQAKPKVLVVQDPPVVVVQDPSQPGD